MFFQKFRTFQKFPVRKKLTFSKSRPLTQNSVFFQKFRTFQKFPVRKKVDFFQKSRPFTQNSVFFQKFRTVPKFPVRKKSTFSKLRFLTQNMIHRHKHLFFPNAFWYICHSLPLSTSKTCRIHAFNRTISTFGINYWDQKLLRIANLIPVGRLRTNFRTFLKRSEY